MKKSRKLLMILGIVLSLAIATGSTLAYLTDTDSDVNVMTLGNVDINQLEYERVVDENGEWIPTDETDKYGYTPDEIQPFTQEKPLYPAVFQDGVIKWDDRVGENGDKHQQSWGDVEGEKTTGAPGSNQLFDDSVKNVQDKFVFVENTGKSDAYVRTWFAFEQGDIAAEDYQNVIMTNTNKNHWSWETVATDVEIEDNKYIIKVATYLGPKSNPTEILAPGSISYPSLLQVYMKPEATNEDCEAIDGNKNGTYDILVLSQAVQTAGFDNAKDALDEAFGEATEENVPWDTVKWPGFIYNTADMFEAGKAGGEYLLGSDYSITNFTESSYNGNRNYVVRDAKELIVDLNGKEISQEVNYNGYTYMYTVAYNGKLTLKGDGIITTSNPGYTGTNPNNGGSNLVYVQSTGSAVIDSGTYNIINGTAVWAGNGSNITINGGTFIGENTLDYTLIYSSGGVIDIYGGFFQCKGNGGILNVADANRNTARINLYGGTFVNQDPTKTQDPNNIKVAEGYTVVSETQENGDIWYTVVKK